MATNSVNYNLVKPGTTDKYDISIFNENADIIDNELANLNKSNIYSTTETKVGTWIDGKPIYRKVIYNTTLTALPSTLSLGITGMIDLVSSSVHVKAASSSDSGWRQIPWLFNTGADYGTHTWAGGWYLNSSGSAILFQCGKDLANIQKLIIILEYTK